ncbi:MAG: ANTAR domain-containing protein [Burkholderiales bacterium]|nr:ANTAR domain-containing protein [Burkholderiales bacterium]
MHHRMAVEELHMRVLVVDESRGRARVLRDALGQAGYEVVVSRAAPLALAGVVARVRPDVIVIDTESPSRDTLEHLAVMGRDLPRPIVMFADDAAPETLRNVMRAGVAAYVVDGLDPARVKSIIDVACARFEEYQSLRNELAVAQSKLAERKVVERAKGLLMKARGVAEGEAYDMLRKLAMDRGKPLAEVAQQVVDLGSLLG